eukprot:Filipodium_phascolosomae@DN2856_c0_g1_i1.p1
MKDTYYIDGKYLPEDECVLSVKDLAVLRGFGVFDYTRTYNKKPFHLSDHLRRFHRSGDSIGLKITESVSELSAIMKECVKRNPQHAELGLRIVYSGGETEDSITPTEGRGKLIVVVTAFNDYPESRFTEGVKVITRNVERFRPETKSTNYLTAVAFNQEAKQAGAVETLYVDNDKRILEGTTSNIFFINNGKLITPGANVLIGITREVVMKLGKECGFTVEKGDVFYSDLSNISQAFLTSSTKEVMPVVKIDDITIGDGKPAKETLTLLNKFREYIKSEEWAE